METDLIKIFAASVIGGFIAGLVMSFVFMFLVNAVWASSMEELHSLNIDCSEEFVPGTTTIKIGEAVLYCRLEKRETALDDNNILISNNQGPASQG